ncbi:MAG: DEAD/DEAH box helicase family protein, partial [Brevibacterium sp.]
MSMPEVKPMRGHRPPLRRHQREALDALTSSVSAESRRSWIVLPPGAGKTRVGLEHAQHLLTNGHVSKIVAFGPNTAIQTQWANAWNSHSSDRLGEGADNAADEPAAGGTDRAGLDRRLTTQFTALTYQSLAVFDDDRGSTKNL